VLRRGLDVALAEVAGFSADEERASAPQPFIRFDAAMHGSAKPEEQNPKA